MSLSSYLLVALRNIDQSDKIMYPTPPAPRWLFCACSAHSAPYNVTLRRDAPTFMELKNLDVR